MTKITKLEDLEIYVESLALVKEIFDLCKSPLFKNEYSLCDQIKRAAMSVSANIAEGYGRQTKADFRHFVSIAIGSSNEILAFLDIIKLNFSGTNVSTIRERYMVLGRRMYAFRRGLNS